MHPQTLTRLPKYTALINEMKRPEPARPALDIGSFGDNLPVHRALYRALTSVLSCCKLSEKSLRNPEQFYLNEKVTDVSAHADLEYACFGEGTKARQVSRPAFGSRLMLWSGI